MPCRLAAPLPRASPSSTVSAWSSRVWPSSTAAAPVAAAAGRGRRTARARAAASGPPSVPTVDPHDAHRVEAQAARLLGRALGRGIRTVLQAVVDDHRAGPQPGRGASNAVGRGERERVGAAAERDEHERGPSAQRSARCARRAPRAGRRRSRE